MSRDSESDNDVQRLVSCIDPQAEAEPQQDSSKSTQTKGKKGPPKKRDTHFLCFPLVTDASVPQLAESLRRFREISTKPQRTKAERAEDSYDGLGADQRDEPTSQIETTDAAGDTAHELQPNTNHSKSLPSVNVDLQILPPITHRPPGTYHLTLGVMDLSKKEEMDRALNLLQELDYAEIFRSMSSQQEESLPRQDRSEKDADPLRVVQPPEAQSEAGAKLSSLNRPVSPPIASDGRTAHFDKDSPLQISLTGLSTFPSSKASRVFFAKPSPSPSASFPLLQFGQAIRRKFREAGFITETRPLVLHATVANMRYAVQARGGRTSKGKAWKYGKARWTEGQVDARELIKCFDYYGGDVEEYVKGGSSSPDEAREYVWAKDIVLNRVAICKMGAEKSDDDVLGQVYPPVGEKLVFS